MTWWQWALGSVEFVTAWWCSDRLTRGKPIVPDWEWCREPDLNDLMIRRYVAQRREAGYLGEPPVTYRGAYAQSIEYPEPPNG